MSVLYSHVWTNTHFPPLPFWNFCKNANFLHTPILVKKKKHVLFHIGYDSLYASHFTSSSHQVGKPFLLFLSLSLSLFPSLCFLPVSSPNTAALGAQGRICNLFKQRICHLRSRISSELPRQSFPRSAANYAWQCVFRMLLCTPLLLHCWKMLNSTYYNLCWLHVLALMHAPFYLAYQDTRKVTIHRNKEEDSKWRNKAFFSSTAYFLFPLDL